MTVPEAAAALAATALVLVAGAPLLDRTGKKVAAFKPGIAATASGAVAFFVSLVVRRLAEQRLGVSEAKESAGDVVAIAFSLFVLAPFDEALRVASVVYPLRSKSLKRPYDGMRLAIGASTGFAAMATARHLLTEHADPLYTVRVVLDAAAHVSLSGLWGFAIARQRRRTIGGPGFGRTFLAAIAFGGIASHLLLARSAIAMWAAIPLVASGVLTSLVARRDLLKMSEEPTKKKSRSSRLRAPSIEELERALLRRPDRPVMLRWILFGALVTVGVLLTMLAGSVVLGHRTGVDFSAVDDAGSIDQSAPPLILLGAAILTAFPFSGYLVARAAAARSVLEPALGASVAIILIVVLLGLAAPIAVVFGLALAPVAFALACTGAFLGLER